jgi:hypothetical protein
MYKGLKISYLKKFNALLCLKHNKKKQNHVAAINQHTIERIFMFAI